MNYHLQMAKSRIIIKLGLIFLVLLIFLLGFFYFKNSTDIAVQIRQQFTDYGFSRKQPICPGDPVFLRERMTSCSEPRCTYFWEYTYEGIIDGYIVIFLTGGAEKSLKNLNQKIKEVEEVIEIPLSADKETYIPNNWDWDRSQGSDDNMSIIKIDSNNCFNYPRKEFLGIGLYEAMDLLNKRKAFNNLVISEQKALLLAEEMLNKKGVHIDISHIHASYVPNYQFGRYREDEGELENTKLGIKNGYWKN